PPNDGMLGIAAGAGADDAGGGELSGGIPRSSSGNSSAYGPSSDSVVAGRVWTACGGAAGAPPGTRWSAASGPVWVELYSDVHAAISAEFDVSSRLAPATTA